MLPKIKRLLWMFFVGLLLTLAIVPADAQSDRPPVVRNGPYKIGAHIDHFTDESRENRDVQTYIWYPALVTKDTQPPYPPDASSAPYPLIIYSHGYGGSGTEATTTFINHLVSQGFVVVGIEHNDTDDFGAALVNRPLDVLFVLNQLAAGKDEGLADIIDTDNVGVTGYSAGSYTSLLVGGARIDPPYLKDWCSTHAGEDGANLCEIKAQWDKFSVYYNQFVSPSSDEMWTPLSDERIHAVLMIAPCFSRLFGDQGLAAVSVPTLLVAGTTDEVCPVDIDANYIYTHLGSADHYLVMLEKRDHGATLEDFTLRFYETAFFGYYLQGKTDYAQYLTPESVSNIRRATMQETVGGS